MKISNINSRLFTTPKYKETSFKSSPVAQKYITSMVKGEGRHLFQILAGTLGLSSIIAWVKALKTEDPNRVNEKLDEYNEKFIEEWNTKVLENPIEALEISNYLDIVESGIWARGVSSEEKSYHNVNPVPSLQKKMFFNVKSGEAFSNTLIEASLKTMKRYVDALLSASDEVREKAIVDIEKKFDSIVKHASYIKESPDTAKLYERITELAKLSVLNNLVGLSKTEESIEAVSEQNLVVPDSERQVSEGYDPVEQAKEFLKRKAITEIEKAKAKDEFPEIPLSRKMFTDKIIEGGKVRPYVYMKHYPFIKKVYESLGTKVGLDLISMLASADRSKSLELYRKYTNDEIKAYNYKNFLYLEESRNLKNASVSQEEFDRINGYCENSIDYFRAKFPKDAKPTLEIKFKPNSRESLQERLKIIADLYQIALNVSDEEMIKPYETFKTVEKDKVVQELVFRLSKQINGRPKDELASHGYDNVMAYLGFKESDVENIREVVNNRGYKTAEMYVNELIENKRCKTKLDNLCKILNNQAFNKYMNTPHVRMRFLERFVLNKRNLSASVKELKDATVEAINELERDIYSQLKLKVVRYNVFKRDEEGRVVEVKTCPQLEIKGNQISLDPEGIHTIF